MGACISCYEKYKMTRPSTTTKNKQCRLLQSRVLTFTYNVLMNQPADGVYCIGQTDATAGWRCANCQVIETARDFSFRVGPQNKVQFQIPLCDDCRLHSVQPQKIYSSDGANSGHFRAFLQLSVVCDLLDIHYLYKQRHPLSDVEIMMVS